MRGKVEGRWLFRRVEAQLSSVRTGLTGSVGDKSSLDQVPCETNSFDSITRKRRLRATDSPAIPAFPSPNSLSLSFSLSFFTRLLLEGLTETHVVVYNWSSQEGSCFLPFQLYPYILLLGASFLVFFTFFLFPSKLESNEYFIYEFSLTLTFVFWVSIYFIIFKTWCFTSQQFSILYYF